MPQREPSAYIWDIRDACITLREGLAGVGGRGGGPSVEPIRAPL
jgi:hypothetical protein